MPTLLLTLALVADSTGALSAPASASEPATELSAPGLSASEPLRAEHRELFDAEGLGPGRFGAFVGGGFPVLTAALGYGLTPDLGLLLRVDSFYFETAELTLSGRWTLRHGGPTRLSLAVHFDAGGTYFDTPEAAETGNGERWFTAESDLLTGAGVIVSGRSLLGTTLFFDGTLQVTGDTESPPQALGGSPPALALGANALLHFGASLPLGRHLNFLALLGLDLHFRALTLSGQSGQSIAMPFAGLGLELL